MRKYHPEIENLLGKQCTLRRIFRAITNMSIKKEKKKQPVKYDMHAKRKEGAGHDHQYHDRMVADFKKRFWISLILTVPILLLSPLIQRVLNIRDLIVFPDESYVLWGSLP